MLIERELLFFALFWFLIGSIDELVIDALWFVLRLKPEFQTPRLDERAGEAQPVGRVAVFVAAWREAEVIGATITRMLAAWPVEDFVLYVGCYGNDPETVAAATSAGEHDPRLRLVISDRFGPTTKADCLNRLFEAMCADERRKGQRYHGVVLHDSEDMVHPLELALIDRALVDVDFVQLPVHPEIPEGSHWVAGHYCDEFADSHARQMVVRDALGAAIPAAGVSCGFARDMLDRLAVLRAARGKIGGPFAAECFTEDYELGMLIKRMGGTSRFLRCRDAQGELIATRSYFPDTLLGAVRQKTRWIHGISLQSWDRLGWNRSWIDRWMMLRDRRAPLTALVLLSAYVLVVVEGLLMLARWHYGKAMPVMGPVMAGDNGLARIVMAVCAAAAVWRLIMRFVFTTREYGPLEGLLSIARMPLANVIMIMAGRRAFFAYCRSLAGAKLVWEKTEHRLHPAMLARKIRR